jgi:hypothetical protein
VARITIRHTGGLNSQRKPPRLVAGGQLGRNVCFTPKADIVQHGGNVRFVPLADIRGL